MFSFQPRIPFLRNLADVCLLLSNFKCETLFVGLVSAIAGWGAMAYCLLATPLTKDDWLVSIWHDPTLFSRINSRCAVFTANLKFTIIFLLIKASAFFLRSRTFYSTIRSGVSKNGILTHYFLPNFWIRKNWSKHSLWAFFEPLYVVQKLGKKNFSI